MMTDSVLTIALALTWAYLLTFLALTMRGTQVAGRGVDYFSRPAGSQRWTALLFKFGFIGSGAWGLVGVLYPNLWLHWPNSLGWIPWLGLGFMLVGAFIAVGTQLQMAGSWRIGAVEATLAALVIGGFFALSRNPVFVGQMILFLGLSMFQLDTVQVILSACVWIAAIWQVRIEEPVLVKSLSQAYQAYATRIPRWLGFVKGSRR
ncbi:MAG: hypothetical protein CFE35_18320 [Novosphingobium sp. PASSN1]|jgi:protein-S-isoprenylcysteine O-methyltransferase Ste14|nr:MAG: hypothetical protein CFE35_18320 [Novosphingobium sp. PASSN1]